MKTGILLLLLNQFGVGFGFLPELNFPAEDMEDSLYGAREVMLQKAMKKTCLAANLKNHGM